jgi:hypothetical protein
VDLGGRSYITDRAEQKEATIGQIVGIWEGCLLFVLGVNFVSINCETGKIEWETTDFMNCFLSEIPNYKQGRPFDNLYLENGKLYNLTGSIYYAFDVVSQAFELLWLDNRKDEFLNIKHATFTEDYIYFTASFNQNISPTVLGVFNRKTLTIDWQHEPNLAIDPNLGYLASLNNAPQVGENELYVLDSSGTLFIFEKDEVVNV